MATSLIAFDYKNWNKNRLIHNLMKIDQAPKSLNESATFPSVISFSGDAKIKIMK